MGTKLMASQGGRDSSAINASMGNSHGASIECSLPAIESLSRELNINSASPILSVSMVTPWKQKCGNAEYAERLCGALDSFSKVTPFDLRNFMEESTLRSKKSVRKHFRELVEKVNSQGSDIVHIQHEFCFFGQSIQRSNHEFFRFTKCINKPIVVTLHTFRESGLKKGRNLKLFLKKPLRYIRDLIRTDEYYKALRRCEAIVVHSHDTYTQLVSTYPKLRKRVNIIQIPIALVESSVSVPSITKKSDDIWMVLTGFVTPYKGHEYAINALEHLPKNFKLVIAGGRHPKDRGASRYWIELLGIIQEKRLQNRVLFTGFLATGGEQAAILKQADLFVLPYKEVGQSGSAVLADALAYDRPVVTSNARSMFVYRMSSDCVYSSVSIDVTDAIGFADGILNMLKNTDESSCIVSHRKAAIARYSLNSIGLLYKQLYKQVTEKT